MSAGDMLGPEFALFALEFGVVLDVAGRGRIGTRVRARVGRGFGRRV